MEATSFIVLSSTRIRTHASRPILRTAKRHYICSTPEGEIRKLQNKQIWSGWHFLKYLENITSIFCLFSKS
jgi:hypothetical protein